MVTLSRGFVAHEVSVAADVVWTGQECAVAALLHVVLPRRNSAFGVIRRLRQLDQSPRGSGSVGYDSPCSGNQAAVEPYRWPKPFLLPDVAFASTMP